MADLNKMIEEIKGMTVLELNDLVFISTYQNYKTQMLKIMLRIIKIVYTNKQ